MRLTQIFDTHAHYDDASFDVDREELLASLFREGIAGITNIGAERKGSEATLSLIKQYEKIYGVLGIHPSSAEEYDEDFEAWLRRESLHEKVLAIGEIGLDYHYDEPERELQKEVFRRQMLVSRELNLPVVIHSRDAAEDTYEILREDREIFGEGCMKIRGIVHCFSYGKEMAERFLRLGYMIGVGGVLCFKNSKKLREVVLHTPIDRICLETDSPYLSPLRGKRNDSGNLPLVTEKIAELKEMTEPAVRAALLQNVSRVYTKWKDGKA